MNISSNVQLLKCPELLDFTIVRLDLSSNKLTNLPGLKDLKGLKRLYLNNNRLRELPETEWPNTLETLFVDNNKLMWLPDSLTATNLRYLLIDYNQITEVQYFPKLRYLLAKANPLSRLAIMDLRFLSI